MSISSISASMSPASAQSVASTKSAAAIQSSSAIKAAVEEATESHAQTVKEAASGDAQARRALQKQAVQPTQASVGTLINVKA